MESYLQNLRDAEKTCIIDKGVKKVHCKFKDGREMAEEWNMDTCTISRRAWKVQKTIGNEPKWEVEIGDPSLESLNTESFGMKESTSNPILSSRITRNNLEWRIRNLPYPIETYQVSVDNEERCITIRTTNKKFFKKIAVPDFDRLGISFDQGQLTIDYKFNTLIITYKKPTELSLFEKLWLEEINRLPKEKTLDFQANADNNVQCPTS